MAKGKTDLVDDFDDPEPAIVRPSAVATLPEPRPFATPAPQPAPPDSFPWGFLVKHPGYGALRIRRDEALNESEAKEVYRKAKCPHIPMDILDKSGFRVSAVAFVPAGTERGK